MTEPREIWFSNDAASSLIQLIGIMTDQLLEGNLHDRWQAEDLIDLQLRLNLAFEDQPVTMTIEEAALLLDGMSFTEIMSVDLPFFEMVQWTSDFITAELRAHWTEDQWRELASR